MVPAKHALELLPAEVWWHVLQQVELGPLADVVRLAQVCRTFCALTLGSETALAGKANPEAVATCTAAPVPPPFAPLRAAAIAHQWCLLSRQRWRQPVRNVGPWVHRPSFKSAPAPPVRPNTTLHGFIHLFINN